MQQQSPGIFLAGFIVAICINLLLFAYIPHSSTEAPPPPREEPRQVVYFRPQPPPQQRQPQQQIQQQPVVSPPPPPPAAVRQITPAPNLASPTLTLALPPLQLQSAQVEAVSIPRSQPGVFDPTDLDIQPRLGYQNPPQYPHHARRRGLSGYVKIEFDVMPNGEVRRLRILESSPRGVFDQAVLTAAQSWQFAPGELLGDRVRTRMVKKVVFNLEDQQ